MPLGDELRPMHRLATTVCRRRGGILISQVSCSAPVVRCVWLRAARVLAMTGCAAAPACGEPSYRCEDSVQCVDADGIAGLCEPQGFCSFPDLSCASGRRFAEHAGAESTTCVIAAVSVDPRATASESVTDSDQVSVAIDALPPPEDDTERVLVAAVAAVPYADSTAVTGGGATWTRLRDQCSARRTTGIALWIGSGFAPDEPVVFDMSQTSRELLGAVLALDVAPALDAATVLSAANTEGVDPGCPDVGTDGDVFDLPVDDRVADAIVFAAVSARNDTVFAEGGTSVVYAEHVAGAQGPPGITVVSATVPALQDELVSGMLGGPSDWAAIAFELR